MGAGKAARSVRALPDARGGISSLARVTRAIGPSALSSADRWRHKTLHRYVLWACKHRLFGARERVFVPARAFAELGVVVPTASDPRRSDAVGACTTARRMQTSCSLALSGIARPRPSKTPPRRSRRHVSDIVGLEDIDLVIHPRGGFWSCTLPAPVLTLLLDAYDGPGGIRKAERPLGSSLLDVPLATVSVRSAIRPTHEALQRLGARGSPSIGPRDANDTRPDLCRLCCLFDLL
ncbi:hypothetical protein PMIN06_008985, partial [Paraphaeosphaeria minitans]